MRDGEERGPLLDGALEVHRSLVVILKARVAETVAGIPWTGFDPDRHPIPALRPTRASNSTAVRTLDDEAVVLHVGADEARFSFSVRRIVRALDHE
jgi:hypothetical protein